MLLKIISVVLFVTSLDGYEIGHRISLERNTQHDVAQQNIFKMEMEEDTSGDDGNETNRTITDDTTNNDKSKFHSLKRVNMQLPSLPSLPSFSFTEAIDKVETMFKSSVQASPVATPQENTKEKEKKEGTISKLKDKARKIDNDQATSIKDGVTGAATGMIKFVKGIQAGKWTDIVQGSLDVIGSIAGMLGPAGIMVSTVLSVLSTVIGLFGGPTGKKESQEGMMERVIKTALLDARNDELTSQVNGAKEIFNTISDTINIFREMEEKNLPDILSFYELSFEGIEIFGILEHYIKKWCAIENVLSKAEKDKLKDDKKKKEQSEKRDMATRCLRITNLYCDLSIYRQILIADMAGVLSNANITTTSDAFLKLIEKERQKDGVILKFLWDPLNFRDRRFVVSKYYSEIHNFPTITTYMNTVVKANKEFQEIVQNTPNGHGRMDNENNEKFKKTLPMALECQKQELQGNCVQVPFSRIAFSHGTNPVYMYNSAGSIYVSDGFYLQVRINGETNAEMKFYGPSVYYIGIQKDNGNTFKYILTESSAKDFVRVCEHRNMAMNGKCLTLERRDYQFSELDRIGWNDKISSLYVPEGLKLIAYEASSFKAKVPIDYYGPATYNMISKEKTWSSIKMELTELRTTDMIKLCSNYKLGGICFYFEAKAGKFTKDDLISTKKDIHQIRSMEVPGNVTVIAYTNSMMQPKHFLAVYKGPKVVSETEQADPHLEIELKI